MAAISAPPPIPGDPIDPPAKEIPDVVERLEADESAKGVAFGVAYRSLNRFNHARSTLLAAGTTYYLFLALFSLLALGYGITALFGAEDVAAWMTEALSEAFPGLLGEEGIDPAELRAVGQAASIVGLASMLYAGGGAMAAMSNSLHLVYGAPPDPRNFFVARGRLLAWLVLLGPLIGASFVAGSLLSGFAGNARAQLGLDAGTGLFVELLAIGVTLLIDFAVVYVVLRRFGGIRPPRRPAVIASAAGALAIQLLRIPMALVLQLSVDKPQYGAFAAPIGVLLVLYLNTLVVYAVGALCAGIAEREVPLEDIIQTIDLEEAQPEVAEADARSDGAPDEGAVGDG